MTTNGGTYPVASGIDGGANSVCGSYGVTAYPTMVLIGPDKTILEQDMSSSSWVTTVEGHGGVAQPCQEVLTADFTISPVTVVFGNSITFNDESLGDPIAWHWTFDGGIPATSTDTVVSVQYNTVGTYPVTLEVTDGIDTSYLTQFVYVVLPSAPTPDFVATETTIVVGESISFLDLTTGTPTEWNWTFQGGSPVNSIDQNPSIVTYNYPGHYNVYLTTTNPWGISYATKYDYITVLAEEPIVEVCDTISNLKPLDSLMVHDISPWGVVPGHNALGYNAYADKYSNPDSVYDKVNGLVAWVEIASPAVSSLKVKFSVWDGATTPDNILGYKEVLINSLTPNYANFIYFDNPITVTGTFWVGYELTYNGQSVFSCSMADDRGIWGSSTMFVKTGVNWVSASEIPVLSNLHTSLGVEPIVCNTTGAIIGIDQYQSEIPFSVYPNPNSGVFTLSLERELAGESLISVYNLTGKSIASYPHDGKELSVSYDLSQLANGVYFIQIENKFGIATRKIVITKD